MNTKRLYTTKLQAGLGLLNETRILFDLWRPGMTPTQLFQAALDSGEFSNISARRLRNIVLECFAARYLVCEDYPANLIKPLVNALSPEQVLSLLLLFTARANPILADFIRQVYWVRYGDGHDAISNDDAKAFVMEAIRNGRTGKPWSDSTIRRVAAYLTGCCADFGLLASGRKSVRQIKPFQVGPQTIAFLAHDLHFQGLGDNALMAHSDWELFGLSKSELRRAMKRLAFKGFLIIQSAGDVSRIGWRYQNWEELLHVIPEC